MKKTNKKTSKTVGWCNAEALREYTRCKRETIDGLKSWIDWVERDGVLHDGPGSLVRAPPLRLAAATRPMLDVPSAHQPDQIAFHIVRVRVWVPALAQPRGQPPLVARLQRAQPVHDRRQPRFPLRLHLATTQPRQSSAVWSCTAPWHAPHSAAPLATVCLPPRDRGSMWCACRCPGAPQRSQWLWARNRTALRKRCASASDPMRLRSGLVRRNGAPRFNAVRFTSAASFRLARTLCFHAG